VCRILNPEKESSNHPQIRIQGVKNHQIPDPDPGGKKNHRIPDPSPQHLAPYGPGCATLEYKQRKEHKKIFKQKFLF
jgi:hypothetical protein